MSKLFETDQTDLKHLCATYTEFVDTGNSAQEIYIPTILDDLSDNVFLQYSTNKQHVLENCLDIFRQTADNELKICEIEVTSSENEKCTLPELTELDSNVVFVELKSTMCDYFRAATIAPETIAPRQKRPDKCARVKCAQQIRPDLFELRPNA